MRYRIIVAFLVLIIIGLPIGYVVQRNMIKGLAKERTRTMKKQKQTWLVTREITQDDVEALGRWYALAKTWYIWMAIALIGSIISVRGDVYGQIGIAILGVELVVFVIYFFKKGKSYWRSVKDKPQPIRLDRNGKVVDD